MAQTIDGHGGRGQQLFGVESRFLESTSKPGIANFWQLKSIFWDSEVSQWVNEPRAFPLLPP